MALSVLSAPYRRVWDFVASDGAIRSLDAATPRRLTRILRDAQLLNGERVTAVHRLQTRQAAQPAARFELQFSGRVAAAVPRRVYLKLVTPEIIQQRGREAALRELQFYRSVTATLSPSLFGMGVVRCLDSVLESDGSSHLLLEDLSETHAHPEWPIPPLRSQVEDAVDWTAAFHATWWEDPAILPLPQLKVSRDRLTELADRHVAAVADQLSARETARMRRIYQSIEGMWRRGLIGEPPERGFVLTHGDLHFWNVLYPVSATGGLAVVDWEFWGVGHPLTEAAYLIGLNWDRSRDPADERGLVARYHRGLVASGRPVPSWEDCWRDYRLAMISLFLVPAVFWARQLSAGIWWPHLRRLHAAYEQLRGDEVMSELR
jgi:hypothetical protein